MSNPFASRLNSNREEPTDPPFQEIELPETVVADTAEKPEVSPEPSSEAKPETKTKKPKSKGGFVIGKATLDLTPEVYKEAVRSRLLKKKWIMGNALILAFSFLVVSTLFVSSLPARTALESEVRVNSKLEAALSEYQTVNLAVEQKGAIQNKLNSAAGNEINWSSLIGSIEGALPAGTSVASVGISTAPNPDKGASILITFAADNPLGYADTLQAVQSAPGVSNVQIGGMTSTGESYAFSATMDYDNAIRTYRYPAAEATGGN